MPCGVGALAGPRSRRRDPERRACAPAWSPAPMARCASCSPPRCTAPATGCTSPKTSSACRSAVRSPRCWPPWSAVRYPAGRRGGHPRNGAHPRSRRGQPPGSCPRRRHQHPARPRRRRRSGGGAGQAGAPQLRSGRGPGSWRARSWAPTRRARLVATAARHKVELPLTEALVSIYEGDHPLDAVERLMSRRAQREHR